MEADLLYLNADQEMKTIKKLYWRWWVVFSLFFFSSKVLEQCGQGAFFVRTCEGVPDGAFLELDDLVRCEAERFGAEPQLPGQCGLEDAKVIGLEKVGKGNQ